MGVRGVQLRPALPRRARRPHRRRHRAAAGARSATQAYRAQLFAAATAQLLRPARRIAVPTLVVHGRHDRVIPVENADRWPSASRRAAEVLDDSGHLYPTEEPAVDEAIARVPRGARRGGRSVSLVLQRGAEPRVADVVRARPPSAAGRRRAAPRRPLAHLRRARRADEPPRTGAPRRGCRRRRARRVPRPDRAGGVRAPLRGEQDRRGRRAAELAARGRRAARVSRTRGRRVLVAGRGVRGTARPRSPRGRVRVDRASAPATRPGSPRTSRSIRAVAAIRRTVLQMYTSGTTGVAEGRADHAPQSRGGGRDVALLAFDADTVSLTPLPMFHIGGIGWAFLGLWNGATTILVSEFVPGRCSTCSRASASRTRSSCRPCSRCSAPSRAPRERDYSRYARSRTAPRRSPRRSSRRRCARSAASLFGIYGLTETTGGVVQLDPARPRPRRPARAPPALGRPPRSAHAHGGRPSAGGARAGRRGRDRPGRAGPRRRSSPSARRRRTAGSRTCAAPP